MLVESALQILGDLVLVAALDPLMPKDYQQKIISYPKSMKVGFLILLCMMMVDIQEVL